MEIIDGLANFTKEEAEKREIRLTLKYPINSLTEIILKRPKAGDIWDFDLTREPSFDEIMKLASRISGQPPDLLKLLDGADSIALFRETKFFFLAIASDSDSVTAS